MAAPPVIEGLTGLLQGPGVPRDLRWENGPECVARAVQPGGATRGSDTADIAPGQSGQNGAAASCLGTGREACVQGEGFLRRREARGLIERSRRQGNEERPRRLASRPPAAAETRRA